MKKNILIVTDYFLDDPNSVSNIVSNLTDELKTEFNLTFLSSNISIKQKIIRKTKSNQDFYYSFKACRILGLIRKLIGFSENKLIYHLYKKIKKRNKFNLIIYLVYNPKKIFYELYDFFKDSYIVILYDTFINRPFSNFQQTKILEEKIISKSLAYFVPDWFYDDYKSIYNEKKVKKIYLPLLNKKNYVLKENNKMKRHLLGYYGQIQKFRNYDKIINILKAAGLTLHIHTTSNISYGNTAIKEKSFINDELYISILNTSILVIFDNCKPYNFYLPSKTILYMSFGKPILVFTDNKKSAVISYLKEYKIKILIDVNKPNIYQLKKFISMHKDYKCDFNYGTLFTHNYFSNYSLMDLKTILFSYFENN